MPSLTNLALAAAALTISSVVAVPDVTVVPATGGCSAFPDSYDPTTGYTAGFVFTLKDAGNVTMEGWGDTSRFDVLNGNTVGRVCFPPTFEIFLS